MPDRAGSPTVAACPSGRVVELVMSNPGKRNALTLAMLTDLAGHVQRATERAHAGEISCLLLRGADGVFTAGFDRSDPEMWEVPDRRVAAVEHLHRTIAATPVPVIAAVERYAIAGGAALAFAADFTVIGQESFIHVPEMLIGMGAPMNIAWLAHRHGLGRAVEMVLGAEPMGAADLYRLGMVHRVAPEGDVVTAARSVAARLADVEPEVVARTKRDLLAISAAPSAFLGLTMGA